MMCKQLEIAARGVRARKHGCKGRGIGDKAVNRTIEFEDFGVVPVLF